MTNLITLIILMLSSLFIAIVANGNEQAWLQDVCQGQVKVVKLHFYIQDALGGANATVYNVTPSLTPSSLGQIQVLDDVVTAKPNPNSKVLGRAQGVLTSADMQVTALTMNLNIVFTAGKYNGSTITILGRNQILNTDRELPVVGGTGVFRMARGYAISNTYLYDVSTSYGVLEYTVYVALPVTPKMVASF